MTPPDGCFSSGFLPATPAATGTGGGFTAVLAVACRGGTDRRFTRSRRFTEQQQPHILTRSCTHTQCWTTPVGSTHHHPRLWEPRTAGADAGVVVVAAGAAAGAGMLAALSAAALMSSCADRCSAGFRSWVCRMTVLTPHTRMMFLREQAFQSGDAMKMQN